MSELKNQSNETESIEEMATLLNNAAKDRDISVENERDACARGIKFELEVAQKHGHATVKGLEIALKSVEARKSPAVRWVDEMAHGTVLGEFIKKMVEEALEKA